MGHSLRTAKTNTDYTKWRNTNTSSDGCVLCQKISLREFTHWRLIANDFPYDRIVDKHDMLVTKIHKTEAELSKEEQIELFNLKQHELNDTYEYIIEPLLSIKSIPDHFHLHLATVKKEF